MRYQGQGQISCSPILYFFTTTEFSLKDQGHLQAKVTHCEVNMNVKLQYRTVYYPVSA